MTLQVLVFFHDIFSLCVTARLRNQTGIISILDLQCDSVSGV